MWVPVNVPWSYRISALLCSMCLLVPNKPSSHWLYLVCLGPIIRLWPFTSPANSEVFIYLLYLPDIPIYTSLTPSFLNSGNLPVINWFSASLRGKKKRKRNTKSNQPCRILTHMNNKSVCLLNIFQSFKEEKMYSENK